MKDWKGKGKGASSLITCCFENLVRRSKSNLDFSVQSISENIPSLNERILFKGIFQLKIKMKNCKIRKSHLLSPKEIMWSWMAANITKRESIRHDGKIHHHLKTTVLLQKKPTWIDQASKSNCQFRGNKGAEEHEKWRYRNSISKIQDVWDVPVRRRVLCNKRSRHSEKPSRCHEQQPPLTKTREKPAQKQWRPSTAKNTWKIFFF